MTNKFLVTLTDEQMQGLDSLMREDLHTNRTAYLVGLIGAELKKRAEAKALLAAKRPQGRPRKGEEADEGEYETEADYSHDKPKNIPHFGRMIGKRELADIEAAQKDFQPQK